MKVTMSAPRLKSWLLLASLLVTISAARPGQAQIPVGNIDVCYNCPKSFDDQGSFFDGPIFFIHNTSGTDITNGVLKIGPGGATTDSFHVGTIAAGKTFAVAPGISNDGGSGHTFFLHREGILDTSAAGPNGNNTQFRFTGQQGSKAVDSGVFTPAPTQGPSLDGAVPNINFLGGPGNNDEPCLNSDFGCFDNIVANLNVPSISVTHKLQPTGQVLFDFTPVGGPTLKQTVDYANSGGVDPSAFFMQITLSVICDSDWCNKYDFLTLNTKWFGTKCLHQNINGIFGCVVSLYGCSKNQFGPFTGPACPGVADPTSAEFIEVVLHFDNELDFSSINAPGLLEGSDNALTCTTPPPGRPACENLRDVFFQIGPGSGVANTGHPKGTKSIFVPGYNFPPR